MIASSLPFTIICLPLFLVIYTCFAVFNATKYKIVQKDGRNMDVRCIELFRVFISSKLKVRLKYLQMPVKGDCPVLIPIPFTGFKGGMARIFIFTIFTRPLLPHAHFSSKFAH